MLEMREYKFVIIFVLIIVAVIGGMVFAEVYKTDKWQAKQQAEIDAKLAELARYDYLTDEQNPVVTINMSDGKKIVVELYPKEAPTTVENFVALINEGFYNGQTFHRIKPDFVIQGGRNMEGTQYTIEGEFPANKIENSISHEAGVISMARGDYYNSANTQFFITVKDVSQQLDGYYAAFGRVIEGMDVVEELANSELVEGTEEPVNPPVMESVTVDTKGIQYAEPKRTPVGTY